jgi:hypothetical protein
MRTISILVIFACLGGFLFAQGEITGPVTGLLVDQESRSIRPILGIPGSAYAGTAAVQNMDFAVAASDGRTALVARESALYVVRRIDAGTPVWRQLGEAAPSGPAAWSENATALAFVSGARVDLWKNVPSEPELAGSIDLTWFTESVAGLAVDPEARYAVATTRSEQGGGLYLLKPGEYPRLLVSLATPGSLILKDGILYASDPGRNEVLRISDWDFSMQVSMVATPGHGVDSPVGIVLSGDAKTLFIASAASRQLLAVDANTGVHRASLELDFTPTRLESMSGGEWLLLHAGVPGESPAQMVNANTLKRAFVPVSAMTVAD